MAKPKIVLLDIETKPMTSLIWRLFDEQGGLPMLQSDWCILSWSAKELDSGKITYYDQRNAKDIDNEKKILEPLWDILDSADIVIGHNVKKFDIKRINARFIKHDLGRPSDYRVIDTLSIAKKHFSFTSNKLEYLAQYLGCKLKKMTQRKYNGMSLWIQCVAGNKDAWNEMELYNKRDTLVLEEVYKKLRIWDDSINFAVYNNGEHVCTCGSHELVKKGVTATNSGIFQRYKCKSCGKPFKSKVNQFTPEQKKTLRGLGK